MKDINQIINSTFQDIIKESKIHPKNNKKIIESKIDTEFLRYDEFEILSIVTYDNGQKEVLVNLGEYLLFNINNGKVKVMD